MRVLITILFLLLLQCSMAQTTRECVVAGYTAQIGVREQGHNAGVQVEKFLSSVRMPKGQPWCAAFVNYILQQCGAPRANSAWSPAWFPTERCLGLGANAKTTPRAGDVFGIYFPAKGRIAHVGFIHQWGEQKVITVEGNTNAAGSREGDGVYKKIRLKKQISAVSRWIE